MPFEYSCFISYRHCESDLGRRAVKDLYEAISGELEIAGKKVFLDRKRLKAGYFYNEVLAEELCRSVCMILVFGQGYFDKDHTYCTREYLAMKKLDKKRLSLLSNQGSPKYGLIIPIIIRGEDYLPAEIKNRRQYEDFSKFTLADVKIKKHPVFAPKIKEIAEYIYERCMDFESVSKDPCKNCSKFIIPTEEDAKEFINNLKPYKQAFPGR